MNELACDQPGCEFVAQRKSGLALHRKARHGIAPTGRSHKKKSADGPEPETPTIPGLDVDDDDAPRELAPGHGRPIAPDAPDATPPGWRDRVWKGAKREKAPKAPGPRRKRESTAEVLALLWSGAGWGAQRLGDAPVGRTMQFQAAAAGPILERVTQDTAVDRLLQPIARNTEAWKAAGALLTLPLFVAIIERSPEAAVTFEPIVRELILANAELIVPVVRKRAVDEQKRVDALNELGFGGVDVILDAIFAPGPNAQSAAPGGAEGPPMQPAPGANGAGTGAQGAPSTFS